MLEEYRFSVPLNDSGQKVGIFYRFVVKNYKKWKTFTINEIIIFTLSINIIYKE